VSEPVYLVDISAYLHRAMHVVYGERAATVPASDTAFIDHACVMLANTMVKLTTRRIAIVCDSTEPSFRCEAYPAYKANRKAHTAVFSAQAPKFFDALRRIGMGVFEEPGYEADDLIASLVHEHDASYVIVSHDKDLFALVDDAANVAAYNPMTDRWFRELEVVERFDVAAKRLYDYFGLLGDSSDGIPGVDGVGAKTASKLIRRFETLEALYGDEEALRSEVTKKQFESLLANKANAFLSRSLALPILCDEIVLTGHGELAAPHPDRVRGATLR